MQGPHCSVCTCELFLPLFKCNDIINAASVNTNDSQQHQSFQTQVAEDNGRQTTVPHKVFKVLIA